MLSTTPPTTTARFIGPLGRTDATMKLQGNAATTQYTPENVASRNPSKSRKAATTMYRPATAKPTLEAVAGPGRARI